MDISPWDRRVQAQHVLDETRNRLSDKRMQRSLGADAVTLLATSMNMQVVDVVDGGKLAYVPDYQNTEMIPLTCGQPGEDFYSIMSARTPQQRYNLLQQSATYTQQYGAIHGNLSPLGVGRYNFSSGAGAITWTTWVDVMAGTQPLGALMRPAVLLRYSPHEGLDVARQVSFMVHELAHVNHIISSPLTHLPRENRSLQTELYAYHTQHLANKYLLNRGDPAAVHARNVERVRYKYNGPGGSPDAFRPKLAIKRALAQRGMQSIYLYGAKD